MSPQRGLVWLVLVVLSVPLRGAESGEQAALHVIETVARTRAAICVRVLDRSPVRDAIPLPLLAPRRERILWCMNALAVGAGLDWTLRGRTLP